MIERSLKIRRITNVKLILLVFIPSAVLSLGIAEGSKKVKKNSNPLVAETPY